MRQKAINLDQSKMRALFPVIVDLGNKASYRVRVDVFAGGVEQITDEQTIALSQKNWRLNGLLSGSLDVNPGDVLLCQILGDESPPSERVPIGVGLAIVRRGDQGFEWLKEQCTAKGFTNLDDGQLLDAFDWELSSPVWGLIDFLTHGLAELVDEAVGGAGRPAISRIGLGSIERTGSTREAVERLSRLKVAIGLGGETLVNSVLGRKRDSGEIEGFDWTSSSDATAPMDFRAAVAGATLSIEVKTTTGGHAAPFKISRAELQEVLNSVHYEIWRVSGLEIRAEKLLGSLRKSDPSDIARETLRWLATSPLGVKVPGVEIAPAALIWTEAELAECQVSSVPSENWVHEMGLVTR